MFQRKTNSKANLALTTPNPDFIPYACHISPDTILTKNGELMQTIKISGALQEQIGAKSKDLRSAVRSALQKHIPDANFALWIHTIRRKKDMSLDGNYATEFSKQVDNEWEKAHHWKESYINEVYLTIIRDGSSLKAKKIQHILRNFSLKRLNNWHDSHLDKSHKSLNNVTLKLKKELALFGAKSLALLKHKGDYYSEPLQFLSKILNLSDRPVKLPLENLSSTLASYKIAFGFNVMEVINGENQKKFSSILTIKEYLELSIPDLDHFLQIPQEFIISQTLDFINSKQALQYYEDQARVLYASGDSEFYETSGLKNVIDVEEKTFNAYGESQLTITLLNSELEGLEKDIDSAHHALSTLGLSATRRDLRMEECYWASLPANFSFTSRRKPINTNRFAGLISLSTEEFGSKEGNHWGQAITTFKTRANTSFYFNFHYKDQGHTAIMGPHKTGKRHLLHFLLAQAHKQVKTIFYLGCSHSIEPFINKLGGTTTHINPSTGGDNLLSLPANQENLTFIYKWLVLLTQKPADQLTEQEKKLLQQAAKFLLKTPTESRDIKLLIPAFTKAGCDSLAKIFTYWCKNEKHAQGIAKSNFSAAVNQVQAVNFSELTNHPKVLIATLQSILFKIEASLSGEPTIIAFDEAWTLLNHPAIMAELPAMLERLTAKNALCVFVTENVTNKDGSLISDNIVNQIATRIFTPNKKADQYSQSYRNVWKLSEAEYEMLLKMTANRQQIMLKTPENSIILNTNLKALSSMLDGK